MLESIAIAMIEAGSDYEPIKKQSNPTMKQKKSTPASKDF